MQEIEEQVTQARGLVEELTAYSEAFQFIVTVADHYADRTSGWFAKWMSVIPPACEGRDYLTLAPSTRGEPAPHIGDLDLNTVSEDDAARGLASIAAALLNRLPEAAAGARRTEDSRAFTHAAAAAAEIHGLLAPDE